MAETLQARMLHEQATSSLLRLAAESAYEYAAGVADRSVAPDAAALATLDRFDTPLPDGPADPREVVGRLHRFGSPATMAQTGGRYFGFVNGGALPVALAARWLADAWDQNSALAVMSPVTAKLEAVTERWLVDLLGLPGGTVAGFVSGTSVATLCGLAAGRWRLLQRRGWDVNANGLGGAPRLRVVTGAHAHATVAKAVALLGLGTDAIEAVPCDDQGRIRTDAMPALDDLCLVVLQAGNVNSGAFDPMEEICARAVEAGAWVHVDGAFGLWAAASPRLRHLAAGAGRAQSWSVDGHKTLNTPYDSGIVLSADAEALRASLQASGAYIAWNEERDGMAYTPEMSRRARATELWAALAGLGRSGVAELVETLHDRAVRIAGGLAAEGFEVLNDVVFNQVLFACESDARTAATLAAIQASGSCWMGGSAWLGRPVIRLSVCSWATTPDDADRTVRACVAARKASEPAAAT